MDEQTLREMVERRGYRLEVILSPLESSRYIVYRQRDMLARLSRWSVTDLSRAALAGFLDQRASHARRTLSARTLEHHMACLRCTTPFLRSYNDEWALEALLRSAEPILLRADGSLESVGRERLVKREIRTEYRLTLLGPESQPLPFCPMCGTPLNEETVGEIDDG